MALLRLSGLAASVTAAFAIVALTAPSSPHQLRDAADALGPVAALAFVAIGGALTTALFPFPVLAAAGGLLFGTGLGTVVSVVAETTCAIAALLIARR